MVDFEKNITELEKRNVQVIAASVDTIENARETKDRYKISFIVGYGLNAREISAKIGAFYENEKGYLHATGFIIDPQGKIANGVYSTLAIGRLVAKDCIALIDHFMKK